MLVAARYLLSHLYASRSEFKKIARFCNYTLKLVHQARDRYDKPLRLPVTEHHIRTAVTFAGVSAKSFSDVVSVRYICSGPQGCVWQPKDVLDTSVAAYGELHEYVTPKDKDFATSTKCPTNTCRGDLFKQVGSYQADASLKYRPYKVGFFPSILQQLIRIFTPKHIRDSHLSNKPRPDTTAVNATADWSYGPLW